jgi:hypothetical protein
VDVEKWNRAKVRSDPGSQARALSFAPPEGIWCVQTALLHGAVVVALVDELKRRFSQQRGRRTCSARPRRTQIRRREVSPEAVPWTATSSAISMAYVALRLRSKIREYLAVLRLMLISGDRSGVPLPTALSKLQPRAEGRAAAGVVTGNPCSLQSSYAMS